MNYYPYDTHTSVALDLEAIGFWILSKILFLLTFLHVADIKPNNIMVDFEQNDDGQIKVKDVQVTDLEDTVILPPGKSICDGMCGNALWRSPESWCRARQSFPSDVFSFGIVVRSAMISIQPFAV